MSSFAQRGWVDDWHPEDEKFWAGQGKFIARRNLIMSILVEHLGFSLWSIWSVVTVSLPAAGFDFSVNQLFWLVAVPNLLGSALRLPYTWAVGAFGGRNWTIVSALLLLIPITLLIVCVTSPATPFWMFLIAAATAGVGGGNFASSMANISFFYPESRKGFVLGINAAGGNLGVAVVQLLVPVLVSIGTGVHLAYVGVFYLPLVVLAAVGSLLYMDNLTVSKAGAAPHIAAARRTQTWVMSFLYIGTFGSFLGYSAALPLLIKTQFPTVHGAYFAWLGAAVGSLSRPVGGWLADRLGGARVTAAVFVGMVLCALLVPLTVSAHSFVAFLLVFLALFVISGIGNGSTYRMIPAIFVATGEGQSTISPKLQAAAAIGIASSVGAFGGFFVNRGFATSLASGGSISSAMVAFGVFYLVCLGVTWFFYLRTRLFVGRVPSLAPAGI